MRQMTSLGKETRQSRLGQRKVSFQTALGGEHIPGAGSVGSAWADSGEGFADI